MQRICRSLAAHGYRVTLVGRKMRHSLPLRDEPYQQRRLPCWFTRGKLFYAEYNIRLFFYLLFKKADAICAIDLDTMLACYYVSAWRRIRRVYDAHELFTGLKEVVTRPRVLAFWSAIERRYVPRFSAGYTVSQGIAEEFERRYGVNYAVVRNMPHSYPLDTTHTRERSLLYMGAVNEARAFEILIPALKTVDARLIVCGDGNFMPRLKQLISEQGVGDRVELRGMLTPEALRDLAPRYWIGMGVAENTGINQYLALPNKFFDYIQAGLPQIAMDFPEYRRVNQEFEVAVLVKEINPESLAAVINNLLGDPVLYGRLRDNCLRARTVLNWEQEEKKLLAFYESFLKQ